ncbi:MAG: hypothetical protein HGA45_19770 [Chloroflexales bacterium]|nr:hypothetical protein [Chloroflexales bacterium]
MDSHRPWCWEAAQTAAGPDWHFIAQVSPESTTALATLAALATPAGFTRLAPADGAQELIDAGNYDTYVGNLAGAARNIWVYNLIRITGDTIEIQAGYGGRGEELSRAETQLLREILATPGMALTRWKVIAGGEGYDYRTLREGEDGESLRRYLTTPLSPSFEQPFSRS